MIHVPAVDNVAQQRACAMLFSACGKKAGQSRLSAALRLGAAVEVR